jgi:hypothetical protein
MKESLRRSAEIKKWIKLEWDDLWTTRQDDPVIAEEFSIKDYNLLNVDRGEIIRATRDYKPISFREILEKQVGKEEADRVDIDPKVGGWKKFSKKHFPPKKNSKREKPIIKHDLNQHQRKGGAGWLNKARILKKKDNNAKIV